MCCLHFVHAFCCSSFIFQSTLLPPRKGVTMIDKSTSTTSKLKDQSTDYFCPAAAAICHLNILGVCGVWRMCVCSSQTPPRQKSTFVIECSKISQHVHHCCHFMGVFRSKIAKVPSTKQRRASNRLLLAIVASKHQSKGKTT